MGRWARKPVNLTSWVALVTPTDRPKSVRNRCLIELFCGVVCVVTEKKMSANLEKPLTLKQLAEDLESSSATLSRAFQELFGMSPMRYLKVRRLNAVRQHLKANDPESCFIATLASQFGFYHQSHFTKDYKAMFGELPSETLRKTAKV